MKLTNKFNLPQAMVDAVKNDAYTRGDADISITQLIKAPREVVLKERHDHEIEEDVSDRMWSLQGQSIHSVLERANRENIAERRLSMQMEGWTISGGMDVYEVATGTLIDYKLTSVWSVINKSLDDWERQLNCYAVLLRANGFEITAIKAIVMLRDWSKPAAERDAAQEKSGTYPQCSVVVKEFTLWPAEKAERYVRERVILHQQARLTKETKDLPLCTSEERWQDPAKWAVMKKGNKRAVKLHDNQKDAQYQADYLGNKNHSLEYRPSIGFKKCKTYCAALPFCDQGKKLIASQYEIDVTLEERETTE